MDLLRLFALDSDDLAILSAHLQDALVRVSDLTFLPRDRRFALVARRFEWEAHDPQPRRRLTGLHFERVLAARVREIDRGSPDQQLSLLAVLFDETTPPGGTVTLVFAGGGAIQLDVECIEAQMKDLGPIWAAGSRPNHEGAASPGAA